MDGETVQAAKSMARDFGNRVRLDFLNDQKANQAMARRVKGPVSAYRVGRAALMNAVAAEGPEVLSNAADGYWRDMGKRYPWLANGEDARGACRDNGGVAHHFAGVGTYPNGLNPRPFYVMYPDRVCLHVAFYISRR